MRDSTGLFKPRDIRGKKGLREILDSGSVLFVCPMGAPANSMSGVEYASGLVRANERTT